MRYLCRRFRLCLRTSPLHNHFPCQQVPNTECYKLISPPIIVSSHHIIEWSKTFRSLVNAAGEEKEQRKDTVFREKYYGRITTRPNVDLNQNKINERYAARTQYYACGKWRSRWWIFINGSLIHVARLKGGVRKLNDLHSDFFNTIFPPPWSFLNTPLAIPLKEYSFLSTLFCLRPRGILLYSSSYSSPCYQSR